MALSPEPPPPNAQNSIRTPFPRYKTPDLPFPPNFSWDDAGFLPETFLDSFETDHSGRQLELRNKVVEQLRGPLTFQHQCKFNSWNRKVARGVSTAHFRSAVSLVIAALDRGYYPNGTEPLLSAPEWAELACAVVSAAGRGYARTHNEDKESINYAARFECRDVVPDASELIFDSLFHRLGATAEALQTYIEGDEQIANWISEVEYETTELLQTLAVRHVKEALATWESLEVSRLANLMLPDLPQHAYEANLNNLHNIASELGYELTRKKTSPQTAGTGPAPHPTPAAAPRAPPSPHREAIAPQPQSLNMDALTAALSAQSRHQPSARQNGDYN
jgi:hypothetical protein